MAGATETKSGGEWQDVSIWTDGLPAGAAIATIAGHTVTLKELAATSILRDDGLLEIQAGDPPSNEAGALSVAVQLAVGYIGTGELTLKKGGTLTTHDSYISFLADSRGLVTVDGDPSLGGDRATWTNLGVLHVGASGFGSGHGRVNLLNGASVNSVDTRIGMGPSTGAADVKNSTWTNSNLFAVGSGGLLGSLSISERGVVNSLTGVIGSGSGGPSALTDTLGSASIDNGTWNNTGDFYVGFYGRAELSVHNGGLAQNTIGYIGHGETSIGDATISDSTWTNSGFLYVGHFGQGTLLIEQGATVTSAGASLANYGGSKGTVTVDNATWTNAGDLYVGNGVPFAAGAHSEGELRVRGGGSVSAATAYIAAFENSRGTATLGGRNTSGRASEWNLIGLVIGDRGSGELTVEDGGIVRSRETYLGLHGGDAKLSLQGSAARRGTLETGQLNGGTGAGPHNGALFLDGGLLRAAADQTNFLRNLARVTVEAGGAFIDSNQHRVGIGSTFSGAGGLTKLGQGSLDLQGDSVLCGTSTVEAGSLLVNGSLSGNVQVESGATLGGNGRIIGLVTVLPAGIVSPGNSPGTLTVGSLMLDQGSSLAIELGAPSDNLVVLGDLTLDGTINFTGDPSGLASGQGQSFLSYGGVLTNRGIVIGSLPGGLDPASFILDLSAPGVLRVAPLGGGMR